MADVIHILERLRVHLEHLRDAPETDDAMRHRLTSEVDRLHEAIARLKAYHAAMTPAVDAAIAAHNRVAHEVGDARAVLQRIMQALGPDVPTSPECRGCAAEIGEALDALRGFGIEYQSRQREGRGDA